MTRDDYEDSFILVTLDFHIRNTYIESVPVTGDTDMWFVSFLRNMVRVPSERDRVQAISILLVRMAIHEAEGNDHEVELCSLGVNALLT